MSFATTEWSAVLAAGATTSPAAREALERLCRAYWYPLYAFVRRQGSDPETAADLTQGFFARLLETDLLAGVDRERGRFRSFLLACLRHYLANERDRARAAKRGGGRVHLSIGPERRADAEGRYAALPGHDITPERLFARRWALTLLEQTLAALREEYVAAGKEATFDALKAYISGDGTGAAYRDVARDLGATEGAVKVAVHRLRKRYQALLRRQVAGTLSDPADIDAELAALAEAL